VLDGHEIVYVLRVPTQKIMAINLSIGSRLPAYCTSMGRMLLAGLDPHEASEILRASDLRALTPHTETRVTRLKAIIDETRNKGWALVDQELEEGLISMAVPIVDARGRTIAAMNISGQANRTPPREMQRRFLGPLREAARRISVTIAAHGKR
jgi:IclR family pca regulon transcriptional regulator